MVRNIDMNYDEARKLVYGMPYDKWKEKFQKETLDNLNLPNMKRIYHL